MAPRSKAVRRWRVQRHGATRRAAAAVAAAHALCCCGSTSVGLRVSSDAATEGQAGCVVSRGAPGVQRCEPHFCAGPSRRSSPAPCTGALLCAASGGEFLAPPSCLAPHARWACSCPTWSRAQRQQQSRGRAQDGDDNSPGGGRKMTIGAATWRMTWRPHCPGATLGIAACRRAESAAARRAPPPPCAAFLARSASKATRPPTGEPPRRKGSLPVSAPAGAAAGRSRLAARARACGAAAPRHGLGTRLGRPAPRMRARRNTAAACPLRCAGRGAVLGAATAPRGVRLADSALRGAARAGKPS